MACFPLERYRIMGQADALLASELPHLKLLNRGKVRDIYDVDDNHLLLVTSDRLSAFDVVLPQPIPGKGEVLTRVANFWFDRTRSLVPNHLSEKPLEEVVPDPEQRATLGDRAIVVRKLKPLPIEAIVRGYLIGSGWKDYQKTGGVCGIQLPEGLQQAEKLPEAIYTPSSKAAVGEHDENISFEQTVELLGQELAEQVRDISLKIYTECAAFAREKGIIIADTKFEFGKLGNKIILIDEILTPDSSRFWPKDTYKPGGPQFSYDKQFVRDYLISIKWDKEPPAPRLSDETVTKTREKYLEAYKRLTGKDSL